jgi:hypothetical protein
LTVGAHIENDARSGRPDSRCRASFNPMPLQDRRNSLISPPCFAAVRPGLLSGRSQQCYSPCVRGPAHTSMCWRSPQCRSPLYRRSAGSTRLLISSKRHPSSPLGPPRTDRLGARATERISTKAPLASSLSSRKGAGIEPPAPSQSHYFRLSTCIVEEPRTRRMLARSASPLFAAATDPSTDLEIASPFAIDPSNAAQFL